MAFFCWEVCSKRRVVLNLHLRGRALSNRNPIDRNWLWLDGRATWIFQGKPIHHTIEEAIEFYEKPDTKKKNIEMGNF